MGRNVIMSERTAVYLDYSYQVTPLERTYAFDPIPEDLEEKYHKYILGIEACLWTEYVPNIKQLEWQIFPRLIAVAEIGWTSKNNRNFKSFQKRLDSSLKRLDFLGINYGR